MIVVNVKLYPYGSPIGAEDLGSIHIVNNAVKMIDTDGELGDYNVYHYVDGERAGEAFVADHVRAEGVLKLLREAIDRLEQT